MQDKSWRKSWCIYNRRIQSCMHSREAVCPWHLRFWKHLKITLDFSKVAKALGAPLDLLMVRKIGAPGHGEFGMGAIVDGPSPQMFLNQDTIRMINPSKEYIEATKQKQLREIQVSHHLYSFRIPTLKEAKCVCSVLSHIRTFPR